ncbi:MAG: substrate-binding domain-containing protein [Bacteroidaceae bacterium]|nr:substrate-binding domain-containing protein [Bacteroidaceae bacterium]
MKSRILFLILSMTLLWSCTQPEDKFLIGISQCSQDEWRNKQNEEMLRQAAVERNMELEIRSVKDDSKKQIEDIRYFLDKKVDLLIVSPNETDAITPIVSEAYDAGIPIIVIDRKMNSNKYTAFIGADNVQIGEELGEYIAALCKNHPEKVFNLTGLPSSSSEIERNRGFMKVVEPLENAEIVGSVAADWLMETAEHVMDSVFQVHPDITLLAAHNDRMAIGAIKAAEKHNLQQKVKFIGVDALTSPGWGVEQVLNKKMLATVIYPTGGERVIQVASDILHARPFEKEITLNTAVVDSTNAHIMMMQAELIQEETAKVYDLSSRVDTYFHRLNTQRLLLIAVVIILALLIGLFAIALYAYWEKNRINQLLQKRNKEIEKQRDQLVELSKQLEDATRAKLAFFTNVSHDFRTPLTLIADPVNQLKESKNLNEDEQFLMNIIQKNVTVLLRLVNQTLDFRKFESGKLTLHLSEFNIAEKVRNWSEAFDTLAERRHINFTVEVKESESPYLMVADSEKMERSLYNLLSNAFKFTPENGKIKVLLSNFLKDGQLWMELVVKDTGVGMSSEHVKHIFENFYQVDVHHAGSGIGLALVKAFAEMHKGSVQVESRQSVGTTFTIQLPMRQEGEVEVDLQRNLAMDTLKEGALMEADQESLKTYLPELERTEKEVVLIIDDNQDVRDYVKMLLGEEYLVIEAANGKEGLKMALKYVPDAIICDVMMPIMNGMECCRHLKSEPQTSHIPVMMLTAYAMDEQKIEGYECGADSYISKPFSAQLLKVRLRNLLENHLRLKNFFTDGSSTAEKEEINSMEQDFVDKLRSLINNNLRNSKLNIDDLSDEMGFSRVQFYRKTKSLTGYAPNELVRITRLKLSRKLLTTTDKNISEIAYEVGFSSPSYFSKCYKDYFGESPLDIQKKIGKK